MKKGGAATSPDELAARARALTEASLRPNLRP
jgi:hypothetical protein